MENMMCDLGIGGFMGIEEDIQPGMKDRSESSRPRGDTEYLGELRSNRFRRVCWYPVRRS